MSENEKHHHSHTVSQTEQVADEIDLRELVAHVKNNKLLIFFFVCISTLLAFVYAINIVPEYETTALLQVENKLNNVDINSALQSISNMSGMMSSYNAAQPSQVETALLQSRYVLQPTILQNHLNISVEPNYFPFFGGWLARKYNEKIFDNDIPSNTLASSPVRFDNNYAWGGEQVEIQKFNVPSYYLSRSFTLIPINATTYQLYSPDNELVLEGNIGQPEEIKSGKFAGISILIDKLFSRIGTEFYIARLPDEAVLRSFAKDLTVSDLGGQDSTTGVLSLTFSGTDRQHLQAVLNTILTLEVKNNVKKKSVEAQKTLDFLNQQLPILRGELDAAETALDNYRAETGSLGISAEGQILLQEAVQAKQDLEQLELKKAELLTSFTSQHPVVVVINKKMEQVNQELNALQDKIKNLPLTEQKAIALEREVRVKNTLYLLLLSKIQQLQVIKAGTVGDVSILDLSSDPIPIASHKILILFGGMLFGFILSLIIIFVRKLFSHSLDDPDFVEEQLGIASYAIVPHSKKQEQLTKEMSRRIPGKGPYVLAVTKPRDTAIEGLRSLRTTLQFSLMEAKNNIISIIGASPGIGKSFISLNLAYVFADSNKKVLLIDADLRKGRMHQYLAQKQEVGLAEILNHKLDFNEAVRVIKSNALDFISCGKYPGNPSEAVITGDFEKLLHGLESQYDIIIIDTPPVLAVTEGVVIAKYSGINLLMVGSGQDTLKELSHTVRKLQKNSVVINGLVFNNVSKAKQAYGSYNYYYYDYGH